MGTLDLSTLKFLCSIRYTITNSWTGASPSEVGRLERENDIPYLCSLSFSCCLPVRLVLDNQSTTRFSRRSRWHQQKDRSRLLNRALLLLKCHYKNPRVRTSTAMPNRSSASRCSPAARPCATGTGKSSKRRHFRRGRMRPQMGE